MARTTPVSNGWMILVRPLGMILPGADGDDVDRAEARPGQRDAEHGDDGRPRSRGRSATAASRRSPARPAERRARRSPTRVLRCLRKRRRRLLLADCHAMPCLQAIERRIAAAGLDQLVVGAVLDDAAALDGDDAVGRAARVDSRWAMMKTVRPSAISRHVLLDDALALVVERAGRLVEDQDARIGDQRAGDGDALALPAGQAARRARRRSCRSLPAARG